MKETKYFAALHLHLAIARHKETSQLVCNSHGVLAGFRLPRRFVSQSSRKIQRYSVHILQKFSEKQEIIRSQWQKETERQYKGTPLGYMDVERHKKPYFRNLDFNNVWPSYGQALVRCHWQNSSLIQLLKIDLKAEHIRIQAYFGKAL